MQVVHTLARGAKAPVRLGLSAGALGLSVMRAVVEEARRAVAGSSSHSSGWTIDRPPPVSSPAPEVRGRAGGTAGGRTRGRSTRERPARPRRGEPASGIPVPPPAAEGPAVPVIPPPGAKQVDDEAIPVAEFAEAGAEEGAGAEVHVDPPWDGYDAMTAADVNDRLAVADSGLAAAVALYERAGRNRVSVVRAAERRVAAAQD